MTKSRLTVEMYFTAFLAFGMGAMPVCAFAATHLMCSVRLEGSPSEEDKFTVRFSDGLDTASVDNQIFDVVKREPKIQLMLPAKRNNDPASKRGSIRYGQIVLIDRHTGEVFWYRLPGRIFRGVCAPFDGNRKF